MLISLSSSKLCSRFTNYLITESEVVTGKSQTEPNVQKNVKKKKKKTFYSSGSRHFTSGDACAYLLIH